MKTNFSIVSRRDALRLLEASGQITPRPERVELTRWLMQMCRQEDWEFTKWAEPLYPALDSFGDVELLMSVEETFAVEIDEVEIRAAAPETFGGLVTFLEPHLTVSPTFQCMVNESLKMGRAVCPTQAAFYAVRRRLCEAGATYSAVHVLRPSTSLRHLTNRQTQALVDGLSNEYGFVIELRRVVWGWMEVPALTLFVLFFVMLICVILSDYVLGGMPTAIAVLTVSSVGIGCALMKCGRYKWPQEYRTLGDVARKIAALSPASQAAS